MWKIPFASALLALAVMAPQPQARGPRSLLAAATEGAGTFLVSLASNRIPAGLVATEDALLRMSGKGLVAPLPGESLDRAFGVFNRRRDGYQARMAGGVTVITSVVMPAHIRGLLNERHTASGVTRTVEGALSEISELLEPGFSARPVVGAHPSLGTECEKIVQQQVTLKGTTTVQELLGNVTRSAPGVAWLLEYSETDTTLIKVGFVCADGSFLRWSVVYQR